MAKTRLSENAPDETLGGLSVGAIDDTQQEDGTARYADHLRAAAAWNAAGRLGQAASLWTTLTVRGLPSSLRLPSWSPLSLRVLRPS